MTITASAGLLDATLNHILTGHPETLPVFADAGLGMVADEGLRASFGTVVTLRTLLKARDLNAVLFCRRLDEAIGEAARTARRQPAPTAAGSPLNLFALLPCPLKVPLEEAFEAYLDTLLPEVRASFTYCLEGNANHDVDYYALVEHFESIDDMPDIIVTPGFNSFFHRPFVERFIKPGLFTSVSTFAGDRHLARLGVLDPQGQYTMLAMNLLVMVVDHARLGDRPVPATWRDLLDAAYRKSVAIRGNHDGSFCETLLLTIHKEFGLDGVFRLGENVRYGWHPSQMVKAAASGGADAPAISAMPYFFARHLHGRKGVSIVWPADGALVSPVTMLVKTGKREALQPLIDFFAGPKAAAICAEAAFPAVHPAVDNRLPDDAVFKWVGWEYVKNHDIKAMLAEINATFRHGFAGGGV
ncbi:ABC transporter substrate-binding protein [Oryzomonas sagensis]|uniref:ABC transporter substrate-binding protein n=1 Tax=Oryzomonas sagensis TaxID=2603857 RepID=A0ABQ6TPK9_9BACT|nr:ABC transporter substrate-binding protein [Oryzomonas sagensis]KAB0670559.1 ABC transporter substrate-binding protein [Oryzomonas sagensis]